MIAFGKFLLRNGQKEEGSGIKLLFAVTVFLLAFQAKVQSDWTEFKNKHHFEVYFPQSPFLTLDSLKLEDTMAYIHNWASASEDTYLSITVTVFPTSFADGDTILENSKGWYIYSQEAELIQGDDEFTLMYSRGDEKNGFPGKVFKWRKVSTEPFLDNNTSYFEYRIYLVNSTVFELVTVSFAKDDTHVKKYFNSFIPR